MPRGPDKRTRVIHKYFSSWLACGRNNFVLGAHMVSRAVFVFASRHDVV